MGSVSGVELFLINIIALLWMRNGPFDSYNVDKQSNKALNTQKTQQMQYLHPQADA